MPDKKSWKRLFFSLKGIFLDLSHDFFLDWALDSKQLEWSVRRDIFSINTNQLLLGMIKAIGYMTYELQIKSGLILQWGQLVALVDHVIVDLCHHFYWKVSQNDTKKQKNVKAICREKQVLAQKDATGFTFGEVRQMVTTEVDEGAIMFNQGVMEQA